MEVEETVENVESAEPVDVSDPVEQKEKKTRTPKVTQQPIYGPSDFSEYTKPLNNPSMVANGNKPLHIETIVYEERLSETATPEETAAYEAATGSVKAVIYKGKKAVNVPIMSLVRRRKKPRAGKDFQSRSFLELTHQQAAELRKASTSLKAGEAPNDTKFDWLFDAMAPSCVWVIDYPTNLNEGAKVMGPEGKVVSAPEEIRYFPRLFVGRLKATDEAKEGEQPIDPGELLHVPPLVQIKWLNDETIERGNSINRVFEQYKNIEQTFRHPIKFDVKEWAETLKEGTGATKKPRADAEEKKEKKPAKRKVEKADVKADTKEKSDTPKAMKTPDTKVYEKPAKRAKTEASDAVDNSFAELAEVARKQGKTLTIFKYVIA